MLTPKEVSERVFPKASFGGYNMGQVDEFLDVLTTDYSALYNENALLKSKMKVLVERVDEYRATEDAMRKALLTAQNMADEMVRDAEKKRADILQEIELEAQNARVEIMRQNEQEHQKLLASRDSTKAFTEKVAQLLQAQLDSVLRLNDTCDEVQVPEAAVEEKTETDTAVADIDDSVQRLIERAMAAPEEDEPEFPLWDGQTTEFPALGQLDQEQPVPAQAEAAEPVSEPLPPGATRQINFANLQFGKDYEIE